METIMKRILLLISNFLFIPSAFAGIYTLQNNQNLYDLIGTLNSDQHIVVINHETVLTQDTIVPDNVTLEFVGHGAIEIIASHKLTVNGSVESNSNSHIFKLNHYLAEVKGSEKTKYAYPEWFGALPDKEDKTCDAGETSYTDHIQNALSSFPRIKFTGKYSLKTASYDPSGALRLDPGIKEIQGGELVLCEGIQLFYSLSGATVKNVHIHDIGLTNNSTAATGTNSIVAIAERSPTASHNGINQSLFENIRINDFTYGILVGADNVVTNNHIINNQVPSASPSTNIKFFGIATRDNSIVKGNFIENMPGGIYAATKGNVLSNNTILNAWGDNGIYAPGSEDLTISGNYINRAYADGIALNSSTDALLSGNTIVNIFNAGFRLQNSKDILVEGNRVDISGCGSHFLRQGQNSNASEKTEKISITANIFKGRKSTSTNCSWTTSTGYPPGVPIHFENEKSSLIVIDNNYFSEVDLNYLNTPGILINAPEAKIHSNTFSNIYNVASHPSEFNSHFNVKLNHLSRMTREAGTHVAVSPSSGTAAIAFGGNGSVFASEVSGIIKSIEKSSVTGRYIIKYVESQRIPVVSVTSTQHVNSPVRVIQIGNNWPSNSSDRTVTETVIELRNDEDQPYWPHYYSQIFVKVN